MAKSNFVKTVAACMVGLVTAVCIVTFSSSPSTLSMVPNVLNCVKVAPFGQSREGLGAILRRNQLAVFLADSYSVKLSFPHIESTHGYGIENFFSKCPTPPDNCLLDQDNMMVYRCPKSDCQCLQEQVHRYTSMLVKRCRVIHVRNNRVRSMEWSGCTRNVLSSYFGTKKKPKIPFDVLHYRAGDMEDRPGGKSFTKDELFYFFRVMCKTGHRDIVVLTEGSPEMPMIEECGNRLVVAADTSIYDAFRVIQHADSVAVGASSFATMMMEVGTPRRMVVLLRHAHLYEWVNCEEWTIIGEYGVVFHFNSKQSMLDAVLSGRDLKSRSLISDKQQKTLTHYKLGRPSRRWSNDSSWQYTGQIR